MLAPVQALPRHLALGRTDRELYPPDVARSYTEVDHEVLETGKVVRRLGQVSRRSLPGHQIDVTKLPLRDEGGEIALLLTIIEDVTEVLLDAGFYAQQLLGNEIGEIMDSDFSGEAADLFRFMLGGAGVLGLLLGGIGVANTMQVGAPHSRQLDRGRRFRISRR